MSQCNVPFPHARFTDILEGLTHFHVGRDSKADKLLLGETSTLTDIAKNDSGRIQECIALQRILLKFTTKLFLTGDLVGRLEEKIEALVEDKQVTSAFYFLPNTFPPPSSIHPLRPCHFPPPPPPPLSSSFLSPLLLAPHNRLNFTQRFIRL